uniref:NADH-ubiquinone oxidoreductase chain 6 n=2 Tax=Psylliodes TaxID=294691 RepID=A0A7L9K3D8_9CUCU|nr:NADH dehydrogenase subunit 6 [Psylliodes chlorophana]QOH99587.1 NADH dehydrogenase subunit 6 [Psylliodes chlorophana]QOK35988.1 NADH dehydrogenase subunit 6 [Psylliodes punctifrons]
MTMILSLLFMNTVMFIFLYHPLSLGLILLLQTILTALISGFMNSNFWYSYMLFLIMIGGMLILFIYMTSIASNEKFKLNKKMFLFNFMGLMIMMMLLLFMDMFYLNYFMNIEEMTMMNLTFNNNLSLKKYFNYPNYTLMIMMIIYLFITLIAVTKITNNSYGPLRQKF